VRKPAFYAADKARDFGAGPLFNQILPLLMSPTLEDQERHLLVKVGAHRLCSYRGVHRGMCSPRNAGSVTSCD